MAGPSQEAVARGELLVHRQGLAVVINLNKPFRKSRFRWGGGPPIREGRTTLEESYCALASMGLLTSIIDTHTKKKNEVGTAGLLRGARGFESGDPKYVCGTNDLTAVCVRP